MALQPADFLTHCGFHRRAVRVWGLECATTITALSSRHRSPPSTLYTCQPRCGLDWLGVASDLKPRGFTEFGGIQRAVSMPAAQFFKSVASTNFAIGAFP